jgi:periplasmic protein TonB
LKAFSLAGAGHLPLTGELHPLRREAARWMTSANGLVLALGIAIFASWYVWSHAKHVDEVPAGVTIVKLTDLGVPPSIKEPTAPQMNVAEAVVPPSIGVPEPVPDEQATESTIASQSQMSDFLTPVTSDDFGSGDSLVVDIDRSPGREEFVAFDEYPVLLSIEKPEYPAIVRDAGIDGTVNVQVLVGKDGKVKKAVAVEGPEVLHAAAIKCAKTGLFKPAIQGTTPVEVWVVVPITFSLH